MGRAARADDARTGAARLPLRALGLLPRRSSRRRVRVAGRAGGLDEIAQLPLTEKRELRETMTRGRTRSARTSARSRAEIVRIYSTSGTTGTPSYIPLTASDLENWVTGSARSYAASGVTAGAAHRLDLQRGAVRRRRGARVLRPHRPLPHPGRHGQHRAAAAGDRAPGARRGGAHAFVRRVPRRVGGRARLRPRGLERRARAGRRRARRRRAGVPREARGRLGREGHRGDGHRRHRRLAVGRVRGAGRHAPRRARLRPRRADRCQRPAPRSRSRTAWPASSC